MARRFLMLLAWWCGFACSGAGAPAEADSISLNAFEFSEYCAETGAARCERCRSDAEEERDECFRVCAALTQRTGSSACFASCGAETASCDVDCGLDPDECVAPGFRFEPSQPADVAIGAACTRANQRSRDCSQIPVRSDCDSSARLERPEAAQVYQCMADLPCGAGVEPCLSKLGESAFGASLAESCPSDPLPEASISAVNLAAIWVRGEVLDDAAVCSAEACSERRFSACVQAWVGAL